MDEIMQCAVCFSDYDTESHKPCMGKCGHTICVICAKNESCQDCPVCRRDGSFQEIMVNFGLMNIIEYKNKKKQEMEGTCSLCKKEATELAICIDCNVNEGILRKDYSESKNEDQIGIKWNTENRSLAECIKQAELSSFCADCSIDSIHCGHRTGAFKKIQQGIFSERMSGIKAEIKGFLNSFDKVKEELNQKLDGYRYNISSLHDYVAQLTFDEFTNYPTQILEFIVNLKIVHLLLNYDIVQITDSIDDIEKKLQANAQSNCTAEKEEIIYHLTHYDDHVHEIGKLEIYAYNTISNTMKMETQISVPNYSNSIVHKNNVYIIGDQEYGNSLKTVEVYNLNEKTRRKLADMNEAQCHPTVCMHNGNILVYGGYSLEEYDFDKNKWKIIGRKNDESDYYSIVSHENDLYGVENINCTITIYKFNKETSVFESVLSSTSVSFHMICHCTSFNGKIFMIGSSYYCYYNPSTKELREAGQFVMEKEVDVRLYSLNNQLYAIDWKSVDVFDDNNNKWNRLWSKY